MVGLVIMCLDLVVSCLWLSELFVGFWRVCFCVLVLLLCLYIWVCVETCLDGWV